MVTPLFFLFYQQLEDERQKARDSHYERINAIHKLQDESKEMHDKEMEVLKNRLLRVSTNGSPFVLQYIMYAYSKATLSMSITDMCGQYVIFTLQEKEMELDSEREKARKELEGLKKKLQVNFNILVRMDKIIVESANRVVEWKSAYH